MIDKYLRFEQVGLSANGKTKLFNVMKNGSSITIGEISSRLKWKEYTFKPFENFILNTEILIEIVDKLNELNKKTGS